MRFLVLTALLASVASVPLSGDSNVDQPMQWSFEVGKLYRYDVVSYTLARLQEGPSTGNVFKARFIFRVKSPGRLLTKLENPQHAVVHQVLPDSRTLPENLKYEPVKNLDLPFEIVLNGGRVQSMSLPSSISLVHENLLKGLIGSMQVDLSAHRMIHHSQNYYDHKTQQGQFRKMETDVTGDCETLYTVTPVASEWHREVPNVDLHQEAVLVTKSKNYGNCNHRVAYHFGVPQGAEWTGTARKTREDQLISHSSTSRIILAKQGPIYKAETTSTVHVHPHVSGKQKAEVISYIQHTFVNTEQDTEAEWLKPEGNRIIKNMLYSLTPKQISITDKYDTSSSSESHEHEQAETTVNRIRRSLRSSSWNRVNSDSSSSDDTSSAYVNDDIPKYNEPAYAALYMNPQPRTEKKQNPMNAQKLVQEIAQQLQNPNNMPKADFLSKFNILVRVIASMSSDQLSQTSRGIEVAKSSTNVVKSDMWMIFRDAVAQAGTLPAFKQIQTWIQTRKIEGEEAAEVVASMVHSLRYPTKDVMIQFFNLALSSEVREQQYLNSTLLIAATKFINMGQVNNWTASSYYPSHMYGRLARKHDNFVHEEILPRLSEGLKQAIEQGNSRKAQVYIKAIGNLGHRSILRVFAPYLEGRIQVSTYLRALIVDNLHTLAHQKDDYARAVLFNILRNTAESYEVRVAAIQQIFPAHPKPAMMQVMAQMTHDDPSVQVRAVLKSSIETAAKLKIPRYWELTRTAQAVSWMLTKEQFGFINNEKNYYQYFENDLDLGVIGVLSSIASEDSLLPKFLGYSLNSKTTGWNIVSGSFSSVQRFIEKYRHQMSHMWQQRPKTKSDHKFSGSAIDQMLNIKRDPQDPLEASVFFRFFNEERYLTFSEDDLNQLPQTMRQYITNLASGVDIHYTKVLNQARISIMFPVAMGMPFIYKYKEPTVFHVEGKAKSQVQFPSNEQKQMSTKMEAEFQYTYARNIDGNVGFLDTLANQYASVGVINKLQITIPVKIQLQIQSGLLKLQIDQLHPEQDTTIVHFSVWPYTANQKKDTLVPVSQDPTTIPIARSSKVSSIDTKFGQTASYVYQLQGYSYSTDYRNFASMFPYPDLMSNILKIFYQNDQALTHYNFRYLGKQSQNKRLSLTVAYDTLYNKKENAQEPLVASPMEDVTPNSQARRDAIVKRVVSGINTARARVVDLSFIVDGAQKMEFILTAALADSPVDRKMQYALFAGRNSVQKGNDQINAVGTVNKPEITSLNFLEALKNDLKMTYNFDIKYGKTNSGNIHIDGLAERSPVYAEALQNHILAKQCLQEITANNYYQDACHKMIVMAHTPDYIKASVSYKDVSPAVRYMIYRFYKIVEYYGFWYTDVNPLKTSPEGKMDIVYNAMYLENKMNMVLNSRYGEVNIKNVPISNVYPRVLSIYSPFSPVERFANYYSRHQYQPYCTVDGSRIRTFSNRTYDYTLTRSWHVVMKDLEWEENHLEDGQLVVLARRPSEQQQELYISYINQDGNDLEIEIKPALAGSNRPDVKVNTKSEKVSEGDLTMYWDNVQKSPLLQFYTQPDGVMMLNIREDRLRVMYDGQRLVVLTKYNRNNTRGLCGFMNREPLDDYLTPQGLLVDLPAHFAASYALNGEDSDPQTQQLQNEARKSMYPRQRRYTEILRSDSEWQKDMEETFEDWGSQNVYRSRSYLKLRGECKLRQQVQYYQNQGEICITTTPLDACQSHCRGEGYKIQAVQVVCGSNLDSSFQLMRNQIQKGENPQVTGVPHIRQYRVPSTCVA